MKPMLFLLVAFSFFSAKAQVKNTRDILFDGGWMFMRGDAPAAFEPAYNDHDWRRVDLPHDWTIEDLPEQIKDSISGPFSRASVGGQFTGHTVGGTGWYRKKFMLPAGNANKQVIIKFDGVYMQCDVWINGHPLGNHPYGYTPFYYDITPWLVAGGENVIAVRVRNVGQNSRWYSGSGIYRHVWITLVEPVHIVPFGIAVSSDIINSSKAVMKIETTIAKTTFARDSFTIKLNILSPAGKRINTEYKESVGQVKDADQVVFVATAINKPVLWSPENPALYIV